MSIKPILFNEKRSDMVRAILDGRKTVTRRVVDVDISNQFDVEYDRKTVVAYIDQETGDSYAPTKMCRYQPGDILYVRETWSPVFVRPRRYLYKVGCKEAENLPVKWHPSIHMPKDAARIWLKVKDVRVERLQECGKSWCLDIKKEGVVTPQDPILYSSDDAYHKALREEFQKLWNSTIKKSDLDRYGWDTNPWVWVIEFERYEKPED